MPPVLPHRFPMYLLLSTLLWAGGAPAAGAGTVAPPSSDRASFQGLKPDISLVADVAGAWFSADAPMMTGAYAPTANGFSLQQLELSLGKAVDRHFRFDATFAFGLDGVEIQEVYASTLSLPGHLRLRVGQIPTRFGRINSIHPHAWGFIDQTLAIGRIFGGEGNRGVGLELSWRAPTPWKVVLVGSETMAAGEETARSFYGDQDLGVESPLDLQSTFAVKQSFSLPADLALHWGLSAATGPNGTGLGNRSDVFGTDLYLTFVPAVRRENILTLSGEWIYRRRQVPGDVWADITAYNELSWSIHRGLDVAARYEIGTPARTLSGEIAQDTLDPEWTTRRQRVATSLSFWPGARSRLRLEGIADLPGWQDRPDYGVLVAFDFSMGTHGTHVY